MSVYVCMFVLNTVVSTRMNCFAKLKFFEEKQDHFPPRFSKYTPQGLSHAGLKATQHQQLCSARNESAPERGCTVSLFCLSPGVVFCPLCGYMGESSEPVTVSQRTAAAWLSWRLLTFT